MAKISRLPELVDVSAVIESPNDRIGTILHRSTQPVYTLEGTLKAVGYTASLMPLNSVINVSIVKVENDNE